MSVIEDGTGKGFKAKVDSENALVVRARTHSLNSHVNAHFEQAYIYYSDVIPSASGSVCFYAKNTNSDNFMVIDALKIWSESAEALDVYLNPRGTPGSTTEVIPVNMNLGSKKQAVGEFYEGTGMTGLEGSGIATRFRLAGTGAPSILNFPSDIVIPSGGSLMMTALTGSIPVEITISFYYDSEV